MKKSTVLNVTLVLVTLVSIGFGMNKGEEVKTLKKSQATMKANPFSGKIIDNDNIRIEYIDNKEGYYTVSVFDKNRGSNMAKMKDMQDNNFQNVELYEHVILKNIIE